MTQQKIANVWIHCHAMFLHDLWLNDRAVGWRCRAIHRDLRCGVAGGTGIDPQRQAGPWTLGSRNTWLERDSNLRSGPLENEEWSLEGLGRLNMSREGDRSVVCVSSRSQAETRVKGAI